MMYDVMYYLSELNNWMRYVMLRNVITRSTYNYGRIYDICAVHLVCKLFYHQVYF